MPRRKSPEIAVRNDVIYAKWRGGRSLASLAEEYQRSPQAVGRIVAAYHPDLEDDTDRALHRGRLETLYEEVQAVADPEEEAVAQQPEGVPSVRRQQRPPHALPE